MEFDRTESSHTERKIQDEVRRLEFGDVDKVYEHTEAGDNSNFEVKVTLRDEKFSDKQRDRIPVMAPQKDAIRPPMVGDKVIVGFMESRTESPVVLGYAYDTLSRGTRGKSGMYRRKFPSRESPTGKGDIKLTAYTEYDGDPAQDNPDDMQPDETVVQVAKHSPTKDVADDPPMKMEMKDSPKDKESVITLSSNQVDKDTKKTLDITMDFKTGVVTVHGENDSDEYQLEIDVKNETGKLSGDGPNNEMGMKFDFDQGTFTLADDQGYGIESDGLGNFTWHHNTIDMDENNGPLTL
jgi:hypothetical protein